MWIGVFSFSSLRLYAWRKVQDLLPPLPSNGLTITLSAQRSVCD